MSWISENILKMLLLAIILFVTYNMYADVGDYFYRKQLSIFDEIFKNNIII
jgi:hypothetical protein